MSLQIWLPLTKDLRNIGVKDSNVTSSNATYNSTAGKLGGCYSFSSGAYLLGTHDFISNSTGDWTFACWMKLNATTTGQTLFSCRNAAAGTGITVFYYGTQWLLDDGARWQFTPRVTIAANTWYHICVVRKKGVGKYLYVNGVLDSSTTTVGTPTTVNTTCYSIGACQSGETTVSGNPLNGYLNDVRFYNHALSIAEIKEISKGLLRHYKLDTPFSINNLVRNTTYTPYNNYSSAGFTATVTNTGRTYDGCKIYRLTYTPGDDATKLNNVRNSLANHGIMGFRRTFSANTKYCFWILCKPISHPDTIVGGTASNISGWTEIKMTKYTDDWYIVGQCRKGNVTTDKTDSIFTSFKTPSAEAGVPITIDFCCPHLLEGYDEILQEYDYVGTEPVVADSSGYSHHGTKSGSIVISTDTPRDSNSYTFNGTDAYVEGDPLPLETKTISIWVKTTWTSSSGYRLAVHDKQTGLAIGWSANRLITYIGSGSGSTGSCVDITTTNYAANQWNHIAVVKTGDKTRNVYVNGIQATAAANNYWSGDQLTLNIGNRHINGAYAAHFNGQLSDFRAYATELSAEDVLALYNVGARVSNTGVMFGCEMKEG